MQSMIVQAIFLGCGSRVAALWCLRLCGIPVLLGGSVLMISTPSAPM